MLTAEEAGVRLNWRGNGCVHIVANRVLTSARPTTIDCLPCAEQLRTARAAAAAPKCSKHGRVTCPLCT